MSDLKILLWLLIFRSDSDPESSHSVCACSWAWKQAHVRRWTNDGSWIGLGWYPNRCGTWRWHSLNSAHPSGPFDRSTHCWQNRARTRLSCIRSPIRPCSWDWTTAWSRHIWSGRAGQSTRRQHRTMTSLPEICYKINHLPNFFFTKKARFY